MKGNERVKTKLVVTVIAALCSAWIWPCSMTKAKDSNDTLKVTPKFTVDSPVTADSDIGFTLSRKLSTTERIAVTIGQTDVSVLFRQLGTDFVYDAKSLPLPAGSSSLTVYLIDLKSSWSELGRFQLAVQESKTKAPATEPTSQSDTSQQQPETGKTVSAAESTEKPAETSTAADSITSTEDKKADSFFKFLPSFAISMEAQPFQSNFPVDARPEKRATFNDLNITGSIKTEGKVGNITTDSNFDFAGSTFKERTLQFGTLGREAPDIDLSSYLTNFKLGNAKFSLGHTSFGNNRHVVNSFSSRGLSVSIPINKRFDISGGIVNGTSVLGIGNFLGVAKVRHQVQGATFGTEFFPKRQNAMRLEITGFNGYLQALNSVGERRVVDAEQSRGIGFRFITSDKTERFKVETGYALSRFFNPRDTTLDPDGNAVPLPASMRSAYYIDSTNQIIKDLKLTKNKSLNLTAGFRLEYVEPLYRSLGASPSADKSSQDFSVDGSIGEISFQAGHARANDNLRNVPSILKLLTRSYRFSLTTPLSALIGQSEKPSPFLPRLGYSIDRTNNRGDAIPVNGGFEISLSTIPNLVNTNQNFSSAWQFPKFNFGYTYNRSFADNRQTDNENKDQLGWVHGVSFGLNPLESISFTTGFTFDSQRNFELNQVNRTKTLNFGTTWKPFKNATFTGELAQTLAGDAAKTNLARNVNYSGQFAYNFSIEKSRFRKFGMQAFARFADAYTRQNNLVEISNQRTRTKIMTAGMTFNFF